jgi:hypothetical protein
MRIVTNPITNAITIPAGNKETGKLTAYKSRIFFDTYTDNAPNFAIPVGGGTGYPLSEAISYNTSLDKFITISIKTDGNVMLHIEGEADPVTVTMSSTSLDADPDSRPTILENSFWYYYGDTEYGGLWYKIVFDPALLLLGDSECVISRDAFSSLPAGAIHAISDTEVVIFHFDEGGIRPVFVASDGTEHAHPGRLFNPTHVYSRDNADDPKTLHYSGATILNGNVFAYLTTYSGSVKGAKYKLADDGINGSWSDFFVAVPEDISIFEIGNVFTHNNRIFMCGKFYRKEEFETDTKYTLLLWSIDGITFSIDRKTLVSPIDLRFLALMENDNLVFSSTNRYHSEKAPYQLIGETTDSVNIEIGNINGNSQGGWSAKVVAGNEKYLDDPILETGVYSKLEIGVYTTNGLEWVKYHDAIISQIGTTFEDGLRGFTVSIQPDAFWHTAAMTHPFYMEMQGKQSVLDTVQVLDNLYKVEAGDPGILWSLSCDFWTKEIRESSWCGFIYRTHAAAVETDWWCDDIKTFCEDYPVLDDSATIEMRLYGWSRAGIPSGAPGQNPVDDTPVETPNDDFYALMLVEDTVGVQTTVVSAIGELYSTYANPPQSWFVEGTREGSYPVVWKIANPGVGYKIIKVGIRVIANSGNTTYNLERVELPGISISITPVTTANPGTELVTDELTSFDILAFDGENGAYLITLAEDETKVSLSSDTTDPIAGVVLMSDVLITPHGRTWGWMPYLKIHYFVEITPLIDDVLTISLGDTSHNIVLVAGVYNSTYIDLEIKDASVIAKVQLANSNFIDSKNVTRILLDVESTLEESEDGESQKRLTITKKGGTIVYFSQRPFSTWNFDCIVRTNFSGDYALTGLLGIASDNNNYVVGYIKNGTIGIGVVRAGIKTTLAEVADASILPDTTYDVRFWHRDGIFGVETKLISVTDWPTRGSQLTYSWREEDGIMASIDDIFHVGTYSLIDPPKFRTVGFRSSQTTIPVLPLDLNPVTGLSDFEDQNLFSGVGGQVDVEGRIFNYLSLLCPFVDYGLPFPRTYPLLYVPLGPFQLRAIVNIVAPYDNDPKGTPNGKHYSAGPGIEFLMFAWLPGQHPSPGVLQGVVMALTDGFSWMNDDSQWKAWITTGGRVVWIRERSRHYSDALPENISGTLSTKVYITNALAEVTPVEEGDESIYGEGTFVYLHSGDKVNIYGFYAVSGHHDQNLKSLLQSFCRLAGTDAAFPGDFTPDDITIASGDEVDLQ